MFCNKCGNQLSDGARFCGRCGNPCATVMPTTPTPPVTEELEMPKASFPVNVPEEPAAAQPEYQSFLPPLPEYPPQPEPVSAEMPPMPEPVAPSPAQPEPVWEPTVTMPVYTPPVQNPPVYMPQSEPAYEPPMPSEPRQEITADDLPPQYRPLGAWAYFGLSLLYSVPVIGFIFLIIFTFSSGNINRRSFTRSYWCGYLIVCILLSLLVGVLAIADTYLLEEIFDSIFDLF